eukprot:CAMPEP_0197283424 /NCGR_PEP_ID=MMETSP1432-20130617/24928_1 /TAXON_ID=44447 /ORGANISM="Pseudo-nitzschia delicatissima, Strain UNC1205" /LENGTH=45 /DNA_ID= /DNA_START= /DNA_END= /DNA_ORIENTATION=
MMQEFWQRQDAEDVVAKNRHTQRSKNENGAIPITGPLLDIDELIQ